MMARNEGSKHTTAKSGLILIGLFLLSYLLVVGVEEIVYNIALKTLHEPISQLWLDWRAKLLLPIWFAKVWGEIVIDWFLFPLSFRDGISVYYAVFILIAILSAIGIWKGIRKGNSGLLDASITYLIVSVIVVVIICGLFVLFAIFMMSD